ncbi:hypothetical protein [Salinarimonas soli]|uniref:Uncharacterized protein n=1 Tax=Salinarimonas soli TaxID=1638099 RepID=A0A5B2VFB2_9HYPH|nr:hypothetical protein [Salinarimonas soli]KAA2237644.1 hypothetical protein F0L46_08160 [Salinarimonas soli]
MLSPESSKLSPVRTSEIRARVKRVLGGKAFPDDLPRIYLWLREQGGSPPSSILEIANFIAHPTSRDKGLATKNLRTFLRHYRMMANIRDLDLADCPTGFVDIIRDNFNRLRDDELLSATGLRRSVAKGLIEEVFSYFEDDGERSRFPEHKASRLTGSHIKALVAGITLTPVRPALTSQQIVADFIAAVENSPLQMRPQQVVDKMETRLALFALASMHGSTITLESGWSANLFAGTTDGMLGVLAGAVTEAVPGKLPEGVLVPFLTSTILASDWTRGLDTSPNTVWRGPIEIGADGRLCVLA